MLHHETCYLKSYDPNLHMQQTSFTLYVKDIVWIHTLRCRYNAVKFCQILPRNTAHSSPVMARYVVSFVDPASDWYSASLLVIKYLMSYDIGPRYNATRLYLVFNSYCPLAYICKITFRSFRVKWVNIQALLTYAHRPKVPGPGPCESVFHCNLSNKKVKYNTVPI